MTMTTSVGETALTTPSDWEIVLTRVVDAPRRRVYEAWTDAEQLPFWRLGPDGWPMPVCEVDVRLGGRWRFVWRRSDGAEVATHGQYREVTPLERLVYTEAFVGDPRRTLNTVLLAGDESRTRVIYTVLYGSPEARDAALRAAAGGAVLPSLDDLAAYLEAME